MERFEKVLEKTIRLENIGKERKKLQS